MSIFDKIRHLFNREKICSINISRYIYYLLFILLITFITTIYFLYYSGGDDIYLKESYEYENAMSSVGQHKISKLEKLKIQKTVYSDLAKLQLANYYLNKKNFEGAIKHFTLLIQSESTAKIYRDYAKLLIIKTKIESQQLTLDEAITMYRNFYKNTEYFHDIATLGESILLITKGEQKDFPSKLYEILTDSHATDEVMYIAKMIDKRSR